MKITRICPNTQPSGPSDRSPSITSCPVKLWTGHLCMTITKKSCRYLDTWRPRITITIPYSSRLLSYLLFPISYFLLPISHLLLPITYFPLPIPPHFAKHCTGHTTAHKGTQTRCLTAEHLFCMIKPCHHPRFISLFPLFPVPCQPPPSSYSCIVHLPHLRFAWQIDLWIAPPSRMRILSSPCFALIRVLPPIPWNPCTVLLCVIYAICGCILRVLLFFNLQSSIFNLKSSISPACSESI
jgi:hypothetical protein